MTKAQLLREVYESTRSINDYLNKLPSDISLFLLENDYINNLEVANAKLMEYCFGDRYTDVVWFLYDWAPGDVIGDDVKFIINDLEDFVSYLIENEQRKQN